MYKEFDFIVSDDKKKERLDVYLTRRIKGTSRSQIKRLIDEKKVFIDKKATRPSHQVSPKEKIKVIFPLPVLPKALPEDIPIDIIYEDKHLLLINKPAGMIVHPSPGTFSGTLVNALLYHIKDLSGINGVLRPGIVHRLDKGTTGIIVVSKDDKTHHSLAYQFAARKMNKIYLAIIWGRLNPKSGRIENCLKRGKKDIRKMVIDPEGKLSITNYKIIEEFSFLSLVEINPLTGRTHQIRAHFASIGHPVFGDLLYGGRNYKMTRLSKEDFNLSVKLLGMIERQALHAYKLGFRHPETDEYKTFTAPLSEDMQKILDLLTAETLSSGERKL